MYADFEQRAPGKLVLQAGGPLLRVRSARVGIDSEIAGEPGGGRLRERVARGQDRRAVTLRLVLLVQQRIQDQVVALDRDLRRCNRRRSPARKTVRLARHLPRDAHARREIVAVGLRAACSTRDQARRLRQRRVIQIQQIVASFSV